jgi:hypothetical protein
MDCGGWKLTAKLQQHTYIHIRHPNDPLKSAIHIHHTHKQQQTHGIPTQTREHGCRMVENNGKITIADAGWWKITHQLKRRTSTNLAHTHIIYHKRSNEITTHLKNITNTNSNTTTIYNITTTDTNIHTYIHTHPTHK